MAAAVATPLRHAEPPDLDRQVCYKRIRDAMQHGLQMYYRQFPERLLDERSKAAMKDSIIGLNQILDILDEYDITSKSKSGDTEG